MTVSKFKVGYRVRSVNPAGQHYSLCGTVLRRDGAGCFVNWDDGGQTWDSDWAFELVGPLKLEVGATVVIDGGKDEWEVINCWSFGRVDLIRGSGTYASADKSQLTVVKAKPEPPKPDYYVNCKSPEPQEDDYFHGQGGVVHVHGGEYRRMPDGASWSLRGNNAHSSDQNPVRWERTLLVRDGKPYTG